MTYHETLHHRVILLDATILQSLVENCDGGGPVALCEELGGLLEGSVRRHVVALVPLSH